METERYTNLRITDETDGSIVALRGEVVTNGDAAVVWDYDLERRRNIQVDRLTNASVKVHKNVIVLTGTSTEFIKANRLSKEDSIRTFKLHLNQGAPPVEVPADRAVV